MSDLLKLKKINLKYQTGKENISVLKNIDFTIKKKETVSVVGESGSGKTSLIMLVGGLEKPTSGKIIFQDQEITRLNEDPCSLTYLNKISEIISEFSVSKFPVGSSAKINSGFIAIALAIATLCCSPPDS